MKKCLLSFALIAFVLVSAKADYNWSLFFQNSSPVSVVQLHYDDAERPKPHHVPALLPVLGYDGNTFVLATPYELEDVTIVIRDENGTVLYYDTVSSITDYYMFLLTDDVIADMFSIELYYGDSHLYGEF